MSSSPPTRLVRALPTAGLVLAALLAVVAGWLTWLSVDTDSGGRSVVDGWGAIGGDTVLAGENLNDLTGGEATFRPALLGVVVAPVLLLLAAVLVGRPRGEHPFRIPAAVAVLGGLTLLGWGVWRLVDPDPLRIMGEDEAMVGSAPWLTLIAGALALVATMPVFLGRLDVATPRPRGRRNRNLN